MKLKKILILSFAFITSFLLFNEDVFAFKEAEWKEQNKNGYYCIYSYSDSGNTKRNFYMSFSNVNNTAQIKDAESNKNGLNCNGDCKKRSSTTVSSFFKIENGKLYCPSYVYFCDTSGNDNYLFSNQDNAKCYAKGSNNGSDMHDRYVLVLSEHSDKVTEYNNEPSQGIPVNTAQDFPTLSYCKSGGVNAANTAVSTLNSVSNKIDDYNSNGKDSATIKSELIEIGKTLETIDIDGKDYCNSSNFNTADVTKNPKKLMETINNKITSKTQELIDSGKISEEDANKILENFQYGGIEYTDREYTCEQLLDSDLQLIIEKGLTWIQIIAPIILIILTSIDFGQAVISQDQDAMKKATSKVVKRFIAAIALFFIPTLVKVIMGWAGFFDTCGL